MSMRLVSMLRELAAIAGIAGCLGVASVRAETDQVRF